MNEKKSCVQEELICVQEHMTSVFDGSSEVFDSFVLPLILAGGKYIRARLFLEAAHLTEHPSAYNTRENRIRLAMAIELLHLATLIHDDVLDEAELRRGVGTIHSTHGNKCAILSGDYVFAKVFQLLAEVGHIGFIQSFCDVIQSLVEGEFLQMEDAYRLDTSVERYLEKSKKKTANLMELAIMMGTTLTGIAGAVESHFKTFGHLMGMLFQLTDDYLDYASKEEISGKPSGIDIKDGIYTYPLLFVLAGKHGEEIKALLGNLCTEEDVHQVVRKVVSYGGLCATEELCNKYLHEATRILIDLEDIYDMTYFRGALMALMHRMK